jgi:hypothetical protein
MAVGGLVLVSIRSREDLGQLVDSMKSSKRKIGMCALAVAAIGLSLAAASFTPAAAQEQKWCVTAGAPTRSTRPCLHAKRRTRVAEGRQLNSRSFSE